MSSKLREEMTHRGTLTGFRNMNRGAPVTLPSAAVMSDPAKRDAACRLVELMCVRGGSVVQGRRRPSGKRSRTWRITLDAPPPRRHAARRDAERDFVMWLQIAYLEATGRHPPRTARHGGDHRKPGPFVRMIAKCLCLVGAPHADAVGLINDLERQRRKMTERRTRAEACPRP
jgi:hypothetical protein